MSKRKRTEYKCKCKCIIKGKGKEKKMVVRLNRIVTVPHCYPSVVRNTLEISIKVCVWIKVKFIITGEGTRAAVRSGTEINCTSRTEVTPIVTGNSGTMGSNTVVEPMRSAMDSVSLIDFREAMSTRGRDVDMRTMRGSGTRYGRKTRTRSDARTSGRGVTVTSFMTPFSTVVTRTMEGGPKRCGWMGCLWTGS